MNLSNDERRAIGFLALLLTLAAAARLLHRDGPIVAEGEELDLAALERASQAALAEAERRRRPLAPAEKIPINTAPAEELERLPRVGPSLARRIVAERERAGAFAGPADLARVPGVGERSIERLAPHLSFEPGPTGRAASTISLPPNAVLLEGRSSAHRAAPAGDQPWERGDQPVSPGLDLNRATAEELERLPGIGPVLARRIVAHRDSAGPFREPADLDRVPGIGPALLARLAPYLRP